MCVCVCVVFRKNRTVRERERARLLWREGSSFSSAGGGGGETGKNKTTHTKKTHRRGPPPPPPRFPRLAPRHTHTHASPAPPGCQRPAPRRLGECQCAALVVGRATPSPCAAAPIASRPFPSPPHLSPLSAHRPSWTCLARAPSPARRRCVVFLGGGAGGQPKRDWQAARGHSSGGGGLSLFALPGPRVGQGAMGAPRGGERGGGGGRRSPSARGGERGNQPPLSPPPPSLSQMTVRDALNSALDEEMDRDASVFVLGEEVREGREREQGLIDRFDRFPRPTDHPHPTPLPSPPSRSANTRAPTKSRAACWPSTAPPASWTPPSRRPGSPASRRALRLRACAPCASS